MPSSPMSAPLPSFSRTASTTATSSTTALWLGVPWLVPDPSPSPWTVTTPGKQGAPWGWAPAEPRVPTLPGLLPTTGPLGAGSTSPSWAGRVPGGCLPTGHTAGRGAGRLSPCSRMLCGAGWAAFHLGPSSPPGSPSVPPSLTGDAYVSPWMCMTVSGGASDPFIPLGGGGHPPTWLGCWGNAWGSHSHVLSRYLVLPPAPAHLFPGGTDQHRGVGEHRPPAALEGLRG